MSVYGENMRIIGYIYLASEKEHHVPVEDQRQQLENYSKELFNQNIHTVFIEEAATLKKPLRERVEGKKLLELCCEGDTVLVARSLWVMSSAKEGLRMLKSLAAKKIGLHCLDLGENISTPNERKLVVSEGPAALILRLLEGLSVCEGSNHSASIKAAKKQLKMKGRYLGGPVPFGWMVSEEGILVNNPAEQKIIAEIEQLREEKNSYREIASQLRHKFNVRLSHEGVRKVLERNRDKIEQVNQ